MTIGRRGFLLAGSAVAGAGVLPVSEAMAAPVAGGRSVTDFGVEPDSDADQTAALQKAIDALVQAKQPIVFPAGRYRASKLNFLDASAVLGVSAMTFLHTEEIVFRGAPARATHIAGISFHKEGSSSQRPLLTCVGFTGIANCSFTGTGGIALQLSVGWSNLQSITIWGKFKTGIALQSQNVFINNCVIAECDSGIRCNIENTVAQISSTITNNRIAKCQTGIAVYDRALVAGNIVSDATDFGLRLGEPDHTGSIVAQGNILENCRVGIGVAPSGDDIFASLNIIKGAKEGAIRAVDGNKLLGPDLSQKSAESYLNLTVAGNVVR